MRLVEMNRTQLLDRVDWLRQHAAEIAPLSDEAADHAGNLIEEADDIERELSRGAPDAGDAGEFDFPFAHWP